MLKCLYCGRRYDVEPIECKGCGATSFKPFQSTAVATRAKTDARPVDWPGIIGATVALGNGYFGAALGGSSHGRPFGAAGLL